MEPARIRGCEHCKSRFLHWNPPVCFAHSGSSAAKRLLPDLFDFNAAFGTQNGDRVSTGQLSSCGTPVRWIFLFSCRSPNRALLARAENFRESKAKPAVKTVVGLATVSETARKPSPASTRCIGKKCYVHRTSRAVRGAHNVGAPGFGFWNKEFEWLICSEPEIGLEIRDRTQTKR